MKKVLEKKTKMCQLHLETYELILNLEVIAIFL
jgi:hypothetical protein